MRQSHTEANSPVTPWLSALRGQLCILAHLLTWKGAAASPQTKSTGAFGAY